MNARYKLAPESVATEAEPLKAEDLALAHIMSLGYLPERAKEILAKYGVPDVVADQVADEHR